MSYVACAKALLAQPEAFYPQFATHNAQSLATILTLAEGRRDFEFQRLHGMGEALYEKIIGDEILELSCWVYAPVGSHEHLLAYLVRRLLENGANTSSVNRIVDDDLPLDAMVVDPADQVRHAEPRAHPSIVLPEDLFGPDRKNAKGIDLADREVLMNLARDMERAAAEPFSAAPIVAGRVSSGAECVITDPADRRRRVGTVIDASEADIEVALASVHKAAPAWAATSADERAACLERAADLMEVHMAEAMAIAAREAVDFCLYYAQPARLDFSGDDVLPGPTGERNVIGRPVAVSFCASRRGTFRSLSSLAKSSAALAAGNAVFAKPAEQTSVMGAFAVQLLHQTGILTDVLHLLPGDGAKIGGRPVTAGSPACALPVRPRSPISSTARWPAAPVR